MRKKGPGPTPIGMVVVIKTPTTPINRPRQLPELARHLAPLDLGNAESDESEEKNSSRRCSISENPVPIWQETLVHFLRVYWWMAVALMAAGLVGWSWRVHVPACDQHVFHGLRLALMANVVLRVLVLGRVHCCHARDFNHTTLHH